MNVATTMPIASRRTFVELWGGVLAAALSASARGASPPGLPAVAVPREAFAETRYRTIDVGGWRSFADARQFFKAHQHQVMIATGVNDPLIPGASMKPPVDMPEIEFHPIDSGHFALEDHYAEIGSLTHGFLGRVMPT